MPNYIVMLEDGRVMLEVNPGITEIAIFDSAVEARHFADTVDGSEVIKLTPCSYCAKCVEDFVPGTIVNYVWVDNNCVCAKCKPTIKTDRWELRYYFGK